MNDKSLIKTAKKSRFKFRLRNLKNKEKRDKIVKPKNIYKLVNFMNTNNSKIFFYGLYSGL